MKRYNNSNWNSNDIEFLKNNYLNYTYPELSEILNRSRSSIQHKISRLGLRKSDYSNQKKIFNELYFNQIDSNEKAYWLGFVAADGHINNYHPGSFGFKLTLKKDDDNFLKKFLKAIDAKFDLAYKTVTLNHNEYNTCEVSFKSKQFVNDLLQYITYNKTNELHIPNIDSKYIRDYIRGFIDGDGCFYVSHKRKNKKSFEIIAYNDCILKEIQCELNKVDIVSKIYIKQNNNKKLGVYANNSLIRLHHYLYDGATIFMQRKYEKSLQILKLAS